MTLRAEMCYVRAVDGALVHFDVRDAGPVAPGTIVTVHGLGEHLAKYGEWTDAVVAAGWHAAALDLRGHGRTPGPRGDFAFDDLVGDLARFVEVVAERSPDLPIFVVAHSLGALVALSYVIDDPHERVAGIVVSNPPLALADPPAWWFRRLVHALHAVVPRMPMPRRSDPERATRDPERRRAIREDPLWHRRITPRAMVGIEAAMERVRERAAEVDLPLLALVSGEDALVDGSSTAAWAEGVGSGDVTVAQIAGAYHEVLNDLGREGTYERVLRWCDARA